MELGSIYEAPRERGGVRGGLDCHSTGMGYTIPEVGGGVKAIRHYIMSTIGFSSARCGFQVFDIRNL